LLELLAKIARQHVGELADRTVVDLGESLASGLVDRRVAGLLEKLAHHRGDAQELCGLRDRLLLRGAGLRLGLGLVDRDRLNHVDRSLGIHTHALTVALDPATAAPDQPPRFLRNSASARTIRSSSIKS